MRASILSVFVLASGTLCAAASDIATSVKVETYAVSGADGAALVDSMNRHGPRHGFLTRAIAQTRYSVDWKIEWARSDGACRLKAAHADLSIAYRYPALSRPASPALARRWTKFMAGVRRHEQTHGKIAREMVSAARKAVARVSAANDPSCRRAQARIERIVKQTYAVYEERQLRFDGTEHRDGGRVDRLIARLIAVK